MQPRILFPGMLLALWLGAVNIRAQQKPTAPVELRPKVQRNIASNPAATARLIEAEAALTRARSAARAQDFATAQREYRRALELSRGVAGAEGLSAEALRGFSENGVALARQRNTQGKKEEAAQILREILSSQFDPKYRPALELQAELESNAKARPQPSSSPPVTAEKRRPAPTIAPPAIVIRPLRSPLPIIQRSAPPAESEVPTPPVKPPTAAKSRSPPKPRATPPRTFSGPAASPSPTVEEVPDVPEEMPPPRGTLPPSAASPTRPAKKPLVKVFFATDRLPSGKRGPSKYFGIDWNKSGEPLVTGVVTVSIPPVHKEGMVERPTPFLWIFERNEDAKKDFVLTEIHVTKGDDFYAELRNEFKDRSANDQSAFVYVHGYNVDFDKAAYDTAQLAYDLDFPGVPMMFSWPSQGEVLAYDGDEETVEFSFPHLQTFLERVARESGAKRIHVMAHSMGNRLLTRALAELVRQPDIQPLFDNIIMASPDVNATVFTRLWPQIKVAAKRFTLYASSDDNALVLSRRAKGGSNFARLGEGGPNIVVIPGLDTIDASGIDTSHIGHSYEMSCKPVMNDLGQIIGQGLGPLDRKLRDLKNSQGLGYWRFP